MATPTFKECPMCDVKSGSPTLCPSCLHNRQVIEDLKKRNDLPLVNPLMGGAISDLISERFRQDRKWGTQNHDEFKWLAILGEEVGEANKAVLEFHFGDGDFDEYRNELVQVAAVAIAMIESYDRKN